jgi:hypothetical protein
MLPGQEDYLFTFDGHYENIAKNMLSHLTHRNGWAVTYTETYTNSYDQPVYMIGCVHLQRRGALFAPWRVGVDSTWAVMVKVTRIDEEKTEVYMASRYIREAEMGLFSRHFRRSEAGVVSEVVRFCKRGYKRRGLLDLPGLFGGNKGKRK